MTHALTRIHLITDKKLIEDVDRLVGSRRRSEFLTEAARDKLKRDKLLQATHEAMKLPPTDVPGWETPAAASKWVHDLRAESDRKRNV